MSLKSKNDKRPIQKLSTDIQVKLCFFVVEMIIYKFLTCLNWVCTNMKKKMRDLQRDKYFGGLEPNPKKTDKMVVHVSQSTLEIIYIYSPLNFCMGSGCSGIIN